MITIWRVGTIAQAMERQLTLDNQFDVMVEVNEVLKTVGYPGASIDEVIKVINRDYPSGGPASCSICTNGKGEKKIISNADMIEVATGRKTWESIEGGYIIE